MPKPSDKKYGYLSNDSKYGFTENEDSTFIYWPTVTHYIYAKKFEGTQHEHTIRKARTVNQVRILARERETRATIIEGGVSVTSTKCKVYGNKTLLLHAKSTWEDELEHHIRTALKQKFRQNTSIRDMLVSTVHLIIESDKESSGCEIDKITAVILMEIRESLS